MNLTIKIAAIALSIALLPQQYSYAQTTIIGGSLGNGDFEASEDPGDPEIVLGPITYENTVNWFHGNNTGPNETVNFTNDSQTLGSTQAGSRAGMPFQNRWQFNDTGYAIGAEGEVFSLSYDFGAGGPAARWTGIETMRTFLFTSTTPVDADTIDGDITELGGDDYALNRANDANPEGDPQWTTRTISNFYTSTAADVGQTVYFGMQFLDGDNSANLFPRIDLINLTVGSGSTPGDFDLDADIDGADFIEWQRTDGTPTGLADWQNNYPVGALGASLSAVPEPGTIAMAAIAGLLGILRRQRA